MANKIIQWLKEYVYFNEISKPLKIEIIFDFCVFKISRYLMGIFNFWRVAVLWHFEFYILKCKNFLISFLDELGNFKQKKITFQNVIFFYILQQWTHSLKSHYILVTIYLIPILYYPESIFCFGWYHVVDDVKKSKIHIRSKFTIAFFFSLNSGMDITTTTISLLYFWEEKYFKNLRSDTDS